MLSYYILNIKCFPILNLIGFGLQFFVTCLQKLALCKSRSTLALYAKLICAATHRYQEIAHLISHRNVITRKSAQRSYKIENPDKNICVADLEAVNIQKRSR